MGTARTGSRRGIPWFGPVLVMRRRTAAPRWPCPYGGGARFGDAGGLLLRSGEAVCLRLEAIPDTENGPGSEWNQGRGCRGDRI
ncbi:hypothetical protein GCM10009627_30550 [Curtobacterium herbarum]|uniref:Uncharacterized protein n=1 Tax=Curtobacterium herbarum TaxID=150122 RepID=A0ABN1ZGL7_9MICO